MGKFDKYEGCGSVLICPVCGDALQLGGPQMSTLPHPSYLSNLPIYNSYSCLIASKAGIFTALLAG